MSRPVNLAGGRVAAGLVLPCLVGGLLWVLPEPVSVTESALMAVVAVSAAFGGRVAAAFAVAVSALSLLVLLDPAGPSLQPPSSEHVVAVALFAASGLVITHIVAALEEARRLAAARADVERRTVEILQGALLPKLADVTGVDVAARYIPASDAADVGGDFYDAFTTTRRTSVFVIGDVVGHGIESAAAMAEARHAVRAYAEVCDTPAEILSLANRALARRQDAYVTCAVATLEPSGALTWSSAGHPPPLVRQAIGARFLASDGVGPPLGTFATAVFHDRQDRLGTGDSLVLYTDGLVEQPGECIDAGLRRLAAAVAAKEGDGSPPTSEALCAAALTVLGDRQRDDVCLLVATRPGTGASDAPSPAPDRHASGGG